MAETENKVFAMFSGAVKKSLEQIETEEGTFKGTPMVRYTFDMADWLFDEKDVMQFDKRPEDEMIRVGARLTGAYAFFGNKAAHARAERDVYDQKKDEIFNKLILDELSDGKYKVTEARARAKDLMADAGIDDVCIGKEMLKNDWEHLMNATDKMVSFIQTTLKFRQNERFRSNQMET